MRRVARAEQGVRTAAEPTETVASTSRTVERHRVSAIATGGRVVGPMRYRSASAIARSLRQASATASPRARAASSLYIVDLGSRRRKGFCKVIEIAPAVGIGTSAGPGVGRLWGAALKSGGKWTIARPRAAWCSTNVCGTL